LEESAITEAIARDKKQAGGHVQWVLLKGIGRPKIVDGKEISPRLLTQSLRDALRTRSRRKES
ncbi:MAG: hypothetical protein M3Y84_14355, partial [Acidobacteriota bacterium]|nr:hypothetical protein [Acidobacteriota bacterium]